MNKTNNIIMSTVAAAVLVALNVGVFMATGNGTLSPINDVLLWGGFVVLNVASILWAISMLGLQPLVISFSYLAGGALAFLGVRGMTDVSAAEITTAGATYGAFGALAIGNATAKVRLTFFNKGQVPFIFILTGLLVLDGVLNSRVSSAGIPVLLNAVLLPFIVAGVVVGLVWSALNRFGIGRKPSEVLAERDAALQMAASGIATVEEKVVIPMPAQSEEAPVEEEEPLAPAAKAKPAKGNKKAKVKKAAKTKKPEPVVAAAPADEEPFFPLEIDSNEEPAVAAADQPDFEVPEFDAALYASGSEDSEGGVMVAEPEVSVETRTVKETVEEGAPVVGEASTKPEAKPAAKDDSFDFLSGHLDLLSKLK